MSKKKLLLWNEDQIQSNLFHSEVIYFPLTRFQFKVTDEQYFRINLNLPIVLMPKINGVVRHDYCLVAEIQSFDKAINNDVYLQVFAYSRFRVLRYGRENFMAREIGDTVACEGLDAIIANLIDVITHAIDRLIRIKGIDSYTFREKLQTYLGLLKENYYDGFVSNVKYMNLILNLGNDIIKDHDNRLNFFYGNFQYKINLVMILIERKVQSIILEGKIQQKLQRKLAQQQKQYLLNERIKLLQSQLEDEERSSWSENWKKAPKYFVQTVRKEMKRLSSLNKLSPEYPQQKKVVEVMTQLPWNQKDTQFDEDHIMNILNASHYGLFKIKESIVDYMTAYKNSQTKYNRVLCFVGGPGIGKTSIAKSIARALDREFFKISLAGCSDGSYLLGSSRVYIYSQPGAIINTMIKSKYNNPVILLDEIDKTIPRYNATGSGVEYALLDILDAENNKNFKDHFIEEGYSLNRIMFIATANNISNIPQPLKDRMSIIHINSYDWDSKIKIAQGWLLPSIKESFGLKPDNLNLRIEIIRDLIENYTLEVGVRQLKGILEKISIGFLRGKINSNPSMEEVKDYLKLTEQRVPFDSYTSEKHFKLYPGRSLGVWAMSQRSIGGVMGIDFYLLPTFDSNKSVLRQPTVLGQASSVMKETAYQAYLAVINYLNDRKEDEKVKRLMTHQVVLSYTGMAIPKDGPSAGLATALAILSLLMDKPINEYICTGEINGRGEVLIVGGIAEKLQGIIKNDYKHFCLPKANYEDMAKISNELKDRVDVTYVSRLEEVVDIILG